MNDKIFLIIALIIVLAAAGWLILRPKGSKVEVPAGSQSGDLMIEPCEIKMNGTRYQADCGTLIVAENRNNATSRLIALPITRIHSAAENPAEPIFHFAGGPGQSNMGFKPPVWLLANHDIVLIGYRGVDGSSKLDCPEVSAAITGVGGDVLSSDSLDNLSIAMSACSKRFIAEGVDLNGYTIPEVVEDMEAARKALGYKQINLLSESYGTRVAQIYAVMHSDSVKRSAMIAVNPPGHFVWKPEIVDEQVKYYAELCRQDTKCNKSTSDLATTIRDVNQSMAKRWLFLPIDPGKVKVVAFSLLFHRNTAPIIFDAYLSAEAGDSSGLAIMSLAYDFIMPNMMTWGEFLAIGYSSDFDPSFNYRGELTTPGAILGSPMSLLVWGSAANFPVAVMPEEYRHVHPTDIETLLVSGSIDFATPAEFAETELLPSLRNGQHIVISEQGHTNDFWSFQHAAAERLLTSFYTTGKADDSLYSYLPMDFKPAMRFPVLAKILTFTGLLLFVGLGLLINHFIRRHKAARVSRSREN
jgi:pimeloyl-ACP methyl ester carboxylesterase